MNFYLFRLVAMCRSGAGFVAALIINAAALRRHTRFSLAFRRNMR